MKKTLTTALTLAAAGVLLLQVPCATAQDGAPPPGAPAAGGPGGGGPGGPGGNREDFRARMAERIKTSLKASDEEWSVIQPLLEKVETKQREALTTRYGGMMGGGRPQRGGGDANGGGGGGRREQRDNANGGGGGAARPERADRGPRGGGGGSPEAEALTETLKNDSASADEIKTKLAALREQRKKSATELTQAREDLKKVLNMRQEATLVGMGILD